MLIIFPLKKCLDFGCPSSITRRTQAPYKMMMAIVRTQPSMKGFMAERLLGSLVFDLSRYADLMLDVMIAVLIFFFPGGH